MSGAGGGERFEAPLRQVFMRFSQEPVSHKRPALLTRVCQDCGSRQSEKALLFFLLRPCEQGRRST